MKHGTTAYRDGCRCSTCRRAMADAAIVRRNRLYLGRTDTLAVSPLGTHRRIQALVALGWSMSSISRHCGYDRSHVALILRRGSPLHIGTARRISEAFEELSMRLPPQNTKIEKIDASRARNIAKRNGWPPPLAWDDIDNPDEQPHGWQHVMATKAETFDELVERGDGLADVCRGLGVTPTAIQKWAERNNRHAGYRLIATRDRGEPGQRNQHSEREAS